MQKQLRPIFIFFLLFIEINIDAQITSASLSGKVTDIQKQPVIGATILVIHEPSGTRYGTITQADGQYTIQGIRAGGPYNIEISCIGMKTNKVNGIVFQLGETFRYNTELIESTKLLEEVIVKGNALMDASKTGAATSITSSEITRMHSITHGIADVIRLIPQVRIANSGAIYFVGTNNRYNNFQIDGTMNNDVYGLAANGSNGGQAGTQPVSLETIEQIQVNIAPFDIRQSGFTGGSINAITKSGTNTLHGIIYGFGNNQHLIGKKYRMINGKNSEKYVTQNEYQTGITLGGPIVRKKLFFFANYEKTCRTYQNPYSMGNSASRINAALADRILKQLQEMAETQGTSYNGNLEVNHVYAKSNKAGLKLDWNVNDKHKFSFRWSLVSAKQLNSASDAGTLNASDFSYDFVSKTHSFVAELQSQLNEKLSNEARISYVRVRDKRQPGTPFPMIEINNVGDGTLHFGNERSSMANTLSQDIWSFTDNLSWYIGQHTLTFGTHNELYHFSNLFIQDAYGSYFFGSPDDFFAGNIKQYRFAQANVAITGNPRWAAAFSAGQLGFYAQDYFNITENLHLTFGVRMDIPLFFDTPTENKQFNEFAISKGWNYKTNSKLSSVPLFSPRLGLHWNINETNQCVLRGGMGIFTGRIPFVWLSNNFSNTGIQLSAYNISTNTDHPDATKELSIILNPNNQGQNAAKLTTNGSQTINVFDKKFKFAQNLRINLALDFKLASINWTTEAVYSKTLNDILYQNLVVDLTGKTLGETVPSLSFDQRPMLGKIEGAETYSGVYALSNTSKGYTYNLSLKGEKKFQFGLEAMISYTYTKSKVQNDGTSSVAQSNWQYNYISGNSNSPELANSIFNIPHIVRAAIFYTKQWKKQGTTTIGLTFDGSSGMPYSVSYNGDLNGDSGYNDLMYIPTDAEVEQMNFVSTSDYTAAQQKANFKSWLANDEYMKKHRGNYFKRNGANEKFECHFDLHLAHKFNFTIKKNIRSLEFSLDIVNISNMLNEKWGRSSASNGYYTPVTYKGNGNFQFLHDADYNMHTYNDYYSRWRGQVGLRFTF